MIWLIPSRAEWSLSSRSPHPLERIEVDVNPDFVRNPARVDGQPAATFAAREVLWRRNESTAMFLNILVWVLMWRRWIQVGRSAAPEVVIGVWNEGNADEWVRRQREGTLRPAVPILAADYVNLTGPGHLVGGRYWLIAELILLPHVAAVLRRRGGGAVSFF